MESCKRCPHCCNPSSNRILGDRCAEDEELVTDQRKQVGIESFALSVDDD
jgi:pyruvate-formate lyase-activating enzyme